MNHGLPNGSRRADAENLPRGSDPLARVRSLASSDKRARAHVESPRPPAMQDAKTPAVAGPSHDLDEQPSPSASEERGSSEGGASFPVVAIGASAGGLQALRQLFGHLPASPGMAFVVIQHLAPNHPSMLGNVLETVSPMPVVEARDGMRAEANRVYVIPPAADLSIRQGVLALHPRQLTGRLHMPIDTFFASLAADARERAIGVVLSGSGSDGTSGLRAIKAEGGFALAQEPGSAEFASMPESAIEAEMVDFRGPPEVLAEELARLGSRRYDPLRDELTLDPRDSVQARERSIETILTLLRQRAGIDFSGYKRTTLLRRIARRMALARTETLAEYATHLGETSGETAALAQDVLIHVTAFFRDPDAFEALKHQVMAPLVKSKAQEDTIRVWVPGCSTGEEAYSLAISLCEAMDDAERSLSLKMFGTDLSEASVEVARRGRYPESALAELSPERISRFFERDERGYRVTRRVRDACVFVKHDLTRDPPFAKLDLISCRNLLIYFDAELQRRVVPILHYCLNPKGHLFLGQSESISGFRDLFTPLDQAHRIFRRVGDDTRHTFPQPVERNAEPKLSEKVLGDARQPGREAQRQADHLLLARYAPPGVIVNERLDVLQFRGRTGAYLEQPPGQPQANVLRMAREGLVGHLHEAIERAKTHSTIVRKTGLQLHGDGEVRLLDLEVVPLAASTEALERYFLIIFEEVEHRSSGEAGSSAAPRAREPGERLEEIDRLRAELVATRDYLQSLISEHQSTTDELASTNEELVAANEELQSTNEELQSAKEELQSTNEELTTVNDQLRIRNLELDQVASDLTNVLASVEIPVIIVGMDLRVRRFTPTARAIASFIPEDVGRPIDDIKLKIRTANLSGAITEVITSREAKDSEVQGLDGRWFRMQIRPYFDQESRLDGAVLAFVDVDTLREARREAESARDFARSIVETMANALVVLDAQLRVVSASGAFLEAIPPPGETVIGKRISELGLGLESAPHALPRPESARAARGALRGSGARHRCPAARAAGLLAHRAPADRDRRHDAVAGADGGRHGAAATGGRTRLAPRLGEGGAARGRALQPGQGSLPRHPLP